MKTNSLLASACGVLLTLVLSGCPDPQATEHDVGAQDAGASDVGFDVAADAPCHCDDGISCTIDACDRAGRCVHWTDCPGSQNCTVVDGITACRPTTRCLAPGDCPSLPCNGPGSCWGDYCRYDWTADRDNDGVADLECGGTDCESWTSSVPGVETCNGLDDDCNGVTDDIGGDDPLNCGLCGNLCPTNGNCVAGECMCPEGRRTCATPGWPTSGCFDTQRDSEHCGDCDTRCYSGTECIAGVCAYQEAFTVTFDAPASQGPVAFAPNGDFLVITTTRPTRITYADGRPDVSVPPAASPYERHVMRLDRSGGFIGVTSLPLTLLSFGEGQLAITDDGFYFAGNPAAPGEYFGVSFSGAYDEGMLGYVPRATNEVAWVRNIPRIRGVQAMRSGGAVLSDGNYYPGPPLRFDVHGDRLSVDPRFANVSARSVVARTDEGFAVLVDSGPGNLDPGGPRRWAQTFLLLCDDAGLLTAEIDLVETVDVIREVRNNRWLFYGGRGLMEATGTSLNRLADIRYVSIDQATFDGPGVAFLQDDGPFPRRLLHRWRDGVEVARSSEPLPIDTLANGHGWRLTNVFPSTSTLTRVNLPPL